MEKSDRKIAGTKATGKAGVFPVTASLRPGAFPFSFPWSVSLAFLLTACASSGPSRPTVLFSDPGQYESLASNAVEYVAPEKPAPVVEEAPAPVAVAPVSVTPTVAAEQSVVKTLPGDSLRVMDGSSLFSLPESGVEEKAKSTTSSPIFQGAVSPSEAAFTALVRGNERFVRGVVLGERRDEARRRALASEQHPHSVVLTSSDSRVPPELIFDQGLGDLLTIRVGGNVLGSAQVASIEHAIEKLGVGLIVIMGHESSEILREAVSGARDKERTLDQDWLVSSLRSNVVSRGLASVGELDPKLRRLAIANVDAVSEQLKVRSRIVREALDSGRVRLVRGMYGLENGRVDFWGL